LRFTLGLGSVFGVFGAAMAFFITYHEYVKHGLEKARVWKESLLSALLAFLVIVGLSGLAASLFPQLSR
jgi:hypothetical protein